ncbi:MAG: hypothetical protein KBD50_02165 [Candidatus Pacebacteria bacterium]|nr:hypothetical protein [Candidatus Paceibacterota bacterium]
MNKKRGFTVFFAVLVGSLALAIGLSIYELLIRELELAQVATQSQFSIYAADAGAECALYWDNKCTPGVNGVTAACVCTSFEGGVCSAGTAFSSTTSAMPNATAGVLCGSPAGAAQDIAARGWPTGMNPASPPDITTLPATWTLWDETPAANSTSATTNFLLLLGNSVNSPCAKVTVAKVATVAGQPSRTTVTSRGYNSCSGATPTRVERAFQVSY